MTNKFSRLLGMALILGALIALWFFLPDFFPKRVSQSGFAVVSRAAVRQLAFGYLMAGIAAGFGLALAVWPFRNAP